MQIAYDAKRFFQNSSGLGNYARDLVRIMATHFPEHTYQLHASEISEKGKEISDLKNVKIFQPKNAFPLWRQIQLGKAAQQQDAQVFHGTSGELPRFWSRKPIKKVVSICDVIFERFPQYYPGLERKLHLNKFMHAGKTADVVVAISEQTKQDCIEFLKIPEHKIQVVYLACHPAMKLLHRELDLQLLKTKYNLPDKFILNVGTIEERKNVLNIVKAIQNTNIPLVVLGRKTSYYKTVLQYIETHKMQKQIIFLEGVSMPELSMIYKLACMLVYPSRFEGFGLPIIESLFSETPVVTTYNSCFPEVAGAHSLFVDPENSVDIKEKIEQLWNNEKLCETIAKHGILHAQLFTDLHIANQWANIYNL